MNTLRIAGQQFDYNFDTIGNRTQTQTGGDQHGGFLRTANYTDNLLNQITSRDVPGYLDIKGVSFATNTVTVNGQTAYRKVEYFRDELPVNNSASALWTNVTVAATGQGSVSGNKYVPQTPEQFGYDADGNMTNDGRWAYTWDAENRLIKMTVNTNVGPQYQLTFAYDAQGRRIERIVAINGVPISTNLFLYDGWNLIAEVGPNDGLVRSYVWGSDLSGSPQGAGGVGGLLEMSYYGSQTTNCYVAYDGNGNVAALVNAADGTVAANYEYGPFGEVIRSTGPMAQANPFRFSTKYQDNESDLLYYGYRYYDPSTGRWPNRDPIGESGFELLQSGDVYGYEGGSNPYLFVANNPITLVDLFGLVDYTPIPPYNPPDLGKSCCCSDPTSITAQRNDPHPTGFFPFWTLHLSMQLTIKGTCYKDLLIQWWTCQRGSVAGYVGSGSSIDASVITPPWPLTDNWQTVGRVNYLTCDGGKWAKHTIDRPKSYMWTGYSW